MNQELIKELARKAGLIAPYGSDREALAEFDYKEFAKLIIQEAGEAFWSEACHVSDLAYEEYSCNSKKIKQHFGVEE
jgi:hypothetical protein